jgi:hypothetical protein
MAEVETPRLRVRQHIRQLLVVQGRDVDSAIQVCQDTVDRIGERGQVEREAIEAMRAGWRPE